MKLVVCNSFSEARKAVQSNPEDTIILWQSIRITGVIAKEELLKKAAEALNVQTVGQSLNLGRWITYANQDIPACILVLKNKGVIPQDLSDRAGGLKSTRY